MDTLFLGFAELEDLVRNLGQASNVLIAKKFGDNFFWRKHLPDDSNSNLLGAYRTAEPLKSFFFPSRETVAVYPESNTATFEGRRSTVLLGAKACDLRSLSLLDRVFLSDDFRDPFYADRREKTLIVGSDCTEYRDCCFCIALGINPWPEESFDLSISEIAGGYLVAQGSPKGESFLKAHENRFQPATPMQLDERQQRRNQLLTSYRNKIAADRLPAQDTLQDNVRRNYQSPIWENRAAECVECGACNLVCPTCHCFLLEDSTRARGEFARARLWDSCQYKSFARVAGGTNPRKRLAERVRNRFAKKFDFFPETAGFYACTGCGRCSEACIAKIDIREVLKELASV